MLSSLLYLMFVSIYLRPSINIEKIKGLLNKTEVINPTEIKPITGPILSQGGRGYWTVYYASPQSCMITFSYSFAQQLWELLLNLIGWFIKLSIQMFQPLIIINRMLCIIIGNLHQFINHS